MIRKIFTALSMAVVLAGAVAQSADARPRHHRHAVRADNCVMTNNGHRFCGEAASIKRATNNRIARASYASADQGSIIGSRPDGCPHAYCGCGLRKFLGLEDTRLNLASNWARYFPHESTPRAGLAAVRSHHVMYIESSAGNGQWLVRDYNSGGGMSRLHVREVRGYTLVDPHAHLASR